ncbi:MAG: zinc ABC transporter solute-binding protein [Bacteroidetes bacterium]|jgi:manganese/zinc/iron transport system substrate-binding protein|nr:zinc ABC transporter solute-binding protein [Bacteroidota bacterium]
MKKTIFALLTALGVWACSPAEDAGRETGEPLKVVCTTGMIADALQKIVGDSAEVESLMGPGVDPHLYKATQGDLKLLRSADVVFYNGLHLEGKMGEVLDKLGRLKPVVALADSLPTSKLMNSTDYAGAYDPHVWFDVSLWSEVVAMAGKNMARLDAENAAYYQSNTAAFQKELATLHEEVRQKISEIPEAQRVLITAHDAFAYFGRAYDIEVRGLQGISTISEYGLKDVSQLVDFITARQIRAVFVESSVPTKALEAVVEGCAQRGHEVRIGGTLYSDAMGAEGTPAGTYTGMVRENVAVIVEGLGNRET